MPDLAGHRSVYVDHQNVEDFLADLKQFMDMECLFASQHVKVRNYHSFLFISAPKKKNVIAGMPVLITFYVFFLIGCSFCSYMQLIHTLLFPPSCVGLLFTWSKFSETMKGCPILPESS